MRCGLLRGIRLTVVVAVSLCHVFEEEDVLANSVVALAKLLVTVESEAEEATFLHHV